MADQTTRPSVLALGYSHVVAIDQAYSDRRREGRETFPYVSLHLSGVFDPILTAVEPEPILNSKLISALQDKIEQERPTLIVASLWANQHFFLSVANSPRRFDFFAPGIDAMDTSADTELIPYELMRRHIDFWFLNVDAILQNLKKLTSVPIVLTPAPPPIGDFRALPGGSSDPVIDQLVAQHGLAPETLRLKFWRLCEQLYVRHALQCECTILRVPNDTMDARGFRREAYFGPDWIHANTAYGELVLGQIEQFASSRV